MKKLKIILSSMLMLIFIIFQSITNGECFDPEVISQLSKNIVESKLMNQGTKEIQPEQAIYVTSTLNGVVESKDRESVKVIQGLVAFNSDYSVGSTPSTVRQWELDTSIKTSNKYTSTYFKYPDNIIRTVRNTAIKTTLGTGIKMTKLSPIWTPVSTVHTAGDTFYKTISSVGKSMQIMNPPVYLQNNPELGQFARFTPSSQKILGVPTSGTCGTWEGHGSYSISGGSVRYKEILQTSGTGPITRTHTDWVTTNVGNYYGHTEICTPATNNFERFVVSRYPTGSYWDTNTSYSHTVKQSQISYRYENIRGVERITPLPSPGVGRWNYSQTSWSIPPSSWTIPRTSYSFPKTSFSIPKTNYNFNHRY